MKYISASIVVLSGAIVVVGSLFFGSNDDSAFGKFAGCVLGLAGLIVLIFFFIVRSKPSELSLVGLTVSLVICLVVMAILTNEFFRSETAIIAEQTTLMTGPSAGSEPVARIEGGHRVKVIDQGDAWSHIEWRGNPVYIRRNKLMPL